MTLAGKLQLKSGQTIVQLDGPKLAIPRSMQASRAADADALIVFVEDRAGMQKHLPALKHAAADEKLLWLAYPKGGQRGTDLNRDRIHEAMRTHGLRTVRQIAIDETWSAIRLRSSRASHPD